MQKQQMLQRPVQKRKDQGDFAVAFGNCASQNRIERR